MERDESGVRGPHIGERLRHRVQGCSHAVSADGFAAEAEAAVADTGGKHLEDRDFVRERGEKGITVPQAARVRDPYAVPDGVVVAVSTGGDRCVSGKTRKDEITVECIAGARCRWDHG